MPHRALVLVCSLCCWVPQPCSAIEIWADSEVVVENGTTGILRCSFRSSEVVGSDASVTWSFQSSQPQSPFFKDPHIPQKKWAFRCSTSTESGRGYCVVHFLDPQILYFANGKLFYGAGDFKPRLRFIGDIDKRDVSIQLSPVQLSDNGTYFCGVRNPPDVDNRARARTELRVVLPELFSLRLVDGDGRCRGLLQVRMSGQDWTGVYPQGHIPLWFGHRVCAELGCGSALTTEDKKSPHKEVVVLRAAACENSPLISCFGSSTYFSERRLQVNCSGESPASQDLTIILVVLISVIVVTMVTVMICCKRRSRTDRGTGGRRRSNSERIYENMRPQPPSETIYQDLCLEEMEPTYSHLHQI